ncbi:Nramp family divalent metal transporter [Gaetbulibacter aestuarii]|uniref:Nramp family divalent metal transporter n=1 Tax=Gaetbulibacter aestuarii TaxID=1502358 RepID=A0ABW7N3S4_9FLAO
MLKWFKNIGPGPLVAAAFIGPGTVTTCTLAGVDFGYALLWAMVLAVFATVVLQEMSARIGLVTQKGISEIIKTEIQNPLLKFIAILLILSAIVIGNTAYEAGNISGAVLGLEAITGNSYIELGWFSFNVLSIIIGFLAFGLLYIGNYKTLEKVLMALVFFMSFAFIITAVITKPDVISILKGIFTPNLSHSKSLLTIIGLIGTTVVPYNIFLHAALVKNKWSSEKDLPYVRKDTLIAIILGGVVSMCIIISGAALQGNHIQDAAGLAQSLEPLFGINAKYFLALGLLAAGVTSAVTAPLAAAYVLCECLGWSTDLRSKRFRGVWMIIIILGVLSASLGYKSIDIIRFAQVANGILLPVIAVFLVWIVNKSKLLGQFKNTNIQNVFAVFILGISILLSLKTISSVFELNLF